MSEPATANRNACPDPLARLVREVPVREVGREALLYVLYSGTLDEVLRIEERGEQQILSHWQEGWEKGGRYWVRSVLPRGLERWRFEWTTLPDPAQDVAPFIAELALGPKGIAEVLPDVIPWVPFTLVRDHVRDLMLDLDPDGSSFVPAELFLAEDGRPVPGRWWHWIPRRRLALTQRGEKLRDPLPFSGFIAGGHTAWQLRNDPAIRDFVATLPCWGMYDRFFEIAFNRPTFGAFKAAGVTGLVESTANELHQMKDHENVARIL